MYTVKLDNLDSVLGCNCSICTSQSILWVFPEPEDIKIQRNGSLAKYEFASKAYFYEVSIASAGTPISGQQRQLMRALNSSVQSVEIPSARKARKTGS